MKTAFDRVPVPTDLHIRRCRGNFCDRTTARQHCHSDRVTLDALSVTRASGGNGLPTALIRVTQCLLMYFRMSTAAIHVQR